jgi:hypothetical protein
MQTKNGLPTIDLEEIYIAVLKRNCKIRMIPRSEGPVWPNVYQWVEIFEDNGVSYKVSLYASN